MKKYVFEMDGEYEIIYAYTYDEALDELKKRYPRGWKYWWCVGN